MTDNIQELRDIVITTQTELRLFRENFNTFTDRFDTKIGVQEDKLRSLELGYSCIGGEGGILARLKAAEIAIDTIERNENQRQGREWWNQYIIPAGISFGVALVLIVISHFVGG